MTLRLKTGTLLRVCKKVGSPAVLMKTCGGMVRLLRHACLNPISRSAPVAPQVYYYQREDHHPDRNHDTAPSALPALSPPLDSGAQPLRADGGRFTLARDRSALGASYPPLLLRAIGLCAADLLRTLAGGGCALCAPHPPVGASAASARLCPGGRSGCPRGTGAEYADQCRYAAAR